MLGPDGPLAPGPAPPRAPPPAMRAIAGALAVGAGALFVVTEPALWQGLHCNATAVVGALAALPLVAVLALYAAAPARLQRLLARRTRVDVADPGHGVALLVMAGTLFFVLGLGGLVAATSTLDAAVGSGCTLNADSVGPGSGDALFQSVLVNLAIFTLPALFYVAFVHDLGPRATLRALGLREESALRAGALGVGAAIAFLLVLLAAEAAASRVVPASYLENPRALEIASALTPLGALVLATTAAVGEEVFFRGFLQPRLGILATAGFFALAHVTYGSVSEVVVVFALALVLGWLYKRTGNLAAPIAMHFAFDLLNLLAGALAT